MTALQSFTGLKNYRSVVIVIQYLTLTHIFALREDSGIPQKKTQADMREYQTTQKGPWSDQVDLFAVR